MVGMTHSVELDAEHRRVYIAARTVEVGGMDMDDERLARHLLGMDSGGISEPVVGMDYVELLCAGNHACHNRVVVYFLHQVVGVTAGEFNATQIVGAHIVEVGVNIVSQAEILVGVHKTSDTIIDIFAVDIPPRHRHLRSAYDLGEGLVLVAVGPRNDESDFHIATLPHSFRQAIACRAEASENVRGKFPTEH